MAQEDDLSNLQMDTQALYREEVFTDRRVGTIQRLNPVTADGSDDDSRAVRYVGQTQVMTPMGALPLSFELEADDLEGAMQRFPEEAQKALEETMRELQEMRHESSSRIVTPESGGGMGGGQGGPGGGFSLR